MIVQGKKQVPTKKVGWVPIKDNPSGIGSSLAFADPQQNIVPTPFAMEAYIETHIVSPQLHQAVQQKQTVVAALELAAMLQDKDDAIQALVEGSNLQKDDILEKTSLPVTQVNCNSAVLHNSFSKQIINVKDEVVRTNLGANHESVLSPVIEMTLDCTCGCYITERTGFYEDLVGKGC